MPGRPVTRGDVLELAKQVGELQSEVHGLIDITSTAVRQAESAHIQAKAAKKSADANPTRADIREARRRLIAWGLVIVLVANVLGILTTTAMVTKCFLEVPKSGTFYTMCNWIPGYQRAEDENKKNLDKFQRLLAEIPKNRTASARQQREINQIKRRLGIK